MYGLCDCNFLPFPERIRRKIIAWVRPKEKMDSKVTLWNFPKAQNQALEEKSSDTKTLEMLR